MPNSAVIYDVLVIGGGASGLAAAIAAARAGAHVGVVEHDVAVGLPILATGNGRCNLSNVHLGSEHYLHPSVFEEVVGPTPEADVAAFFDSIGVWTYEIDGRLYPYSLRAESVRTALLDECARLNIDLMPMRRDYRAHWSEGSDGAAWTMAAYKPADPIRPRTSLRDPEGIRYMRNSLRQCKKVEAEARARAIVFAHGGNDQAYRAALCCKLMGNASQTPVLCPVECMFPHDVSMEPLNGLRVEAKLTLLRKEVPIWSEEGEVLFRESSISGIVSFNLSRRINSWSNIEIDLFPRMSEDELAERFIERSKNFEYLALAGEEWFHGLLAPAMAKTLLELSGASASEGAMAHLVKHIPLTVRGIASPQLAQAHRGGIGFQNVDLETLELKSAECSHAFACGEVLDMDADCGGYNLAWAWLTGLKAGRSAAAAALASREA